MKKLVVLTGAGISAESGIQTFRDADGLWEGHDIMEVATPEGFAKNPELVLDFYNQRRKQLHEVQPNAAHIALAELEQCYDVTIITQNVDDLHERAGSTKVMHLHGELFKVRSVLDEQEILDWKKDLTLEDKSSSGAPLRPHIVWFGEAVPMMEQAIDATIKADYFMIVGTSMQVYPAAGLVDYTAPEIPIYYIDAHPAKIHDIGNPLYVIPKKATEGVLEVSEYLQQNA